MCTVHFHDMIATVFSPHSLLPTNTVKEHGKRRRSAQVSEVVRPGAPSSVLAPSSDALCS